MQNVSSAPLDVNVQHLFAFASEQSAATWQIRTFVVSVQVWPRWVGQAFADVHDAPSAEMPHCGYVPVPFAVYTPQQTGDAPPHSSGPSQLTWSAVGHEAVATHLNVVGDPGIAQHAWSTGHAVLPPQPKSSSGASICLPESIFVVPLSIFGFDGELPPHASSAIQNAVRTNMCRR